LLNAKLPPSSGFGTVYNNIGKLQNEGLELSLSTINFQRKNFSWETSFNISFNRNKILALGRGENELYSNPPLRIFNQSPLWLAQVGGPAASFYGYIWDGVYQYADFDQATGGAYVLKANVPTNGDPRAQIQPGDIKYKDLNGDLVVDDKDRTVIGRGLPKHTGGISNNFSYKGFDLSAFLQWSYGNNIMIIIS
jgi:TonB-dependent starch-binding outer membrane protein SusC